VITLDTALPDGQVWTLGRTLREADAHVGIVIITDDPGDDTLFRALDCGASALVHKSAPIREILSAVRHAAGSPASFTASGPSVALRRRRETPERAVLSPREQQILLLLHDGLSVPQVAAELFVSLSTAKTYVARRYDKLDARDRAQALMAAVRLGLLDEHAATRHDPAFG
jgi:DNA-binding NarL/FixJ family response regulator